MSALPSNPFVLIIFGATGDLARNKLFPSLFSLFKRGELSPDAYIVGFSRREITTEEFVNLIKQQLENQEGYSEELWEKFSKLLTYQKGTFDEEQGYTELIQTLNQFDEKMGACITRIFYLATQPDNYESILSYLKSTKLSEGCGQGSDKWTRIAIEKPFGNDLDTAKALDMQLADIFEERQIFRVDHYLGKETVQNILAFRFANGIFEPMWHKEFIDHVQITFAETKGISGRGMFFDGVGILRDVAQNHLLQLVAAVAMEQPKSFMKESVRDARAAAIKAVKALSQEEIHNNVIRGQYEGYQEEENVGVNSNTESFVALKLFVDTPRFQDVPFYIRAGKKMPENLVEIKIIFRATCHILFKEYGCPEIGNVLTIRIQPDEGIGLRVIAKKPHFVKTSRGKPESKFALETVDLKFTYEEEFGSRGADAYEKLLVDILMGDQMLFNRSDELQSSWEFITNILTGWEKEGTDLPAGEAGVQRYKGSEWGPKEANELIEKDGRKWL
jgi:glucose-6-phosphate 1-dehydrogenase